MQDAALTLHGWVYDMSNGGIKVVQRNNLACRE
jgi:carbonic anhydrase